MAGIDARTGKPLSDFAHVIQSLEKIVTTFVGERKMREWVGNPGIKLLGENLTQQNVLLWYNVVWLLVEVFEPRFKISRFETNSVDRLGNLDATMVGYYRPYAHLDWQQARLYLSIRDGTVRLVDAA